MRGERPGASPSDLLKESGLIGVRLRFFIVLCQYKCLVSVYFVRNCFTLFHTFLLPFIPLSPNILCRVCGTSLDGVILGMPKYLQKNAT